MGRARAPERERESERESVRGSLDRPVRSTTPPHASSSDSVQQQKAKESSMAGRWSRGEKTLRKW